MTFRCLNRIQAPEEKIPSLNLQNLQANFYPYGIIYSVTEEKILLQMTMLSIPPLCNALLKSPHTILHPQDNSTDQTSHGESVRACHETGNYYGNPSSIF